MHTNYSLDETLDAIVLAAKVSVPGFDHAGISTIDRSGTITTRAATDEMVLKLDQLQYSLSEGPCVDSMREARVVSAPNIEHDERWPNYVAEATRSTGLRAQLGIRLFLDGQDTLGGLNLYSTQTAEIDDDSIAVAELFAAHAALALGNAREIDQLNTALQSRKVIGQALGLLMERYRMSEDRAFAFLTRASSHGNIKLITVAQELVDEANKREVDNR
jgi:GAF domain-containing protein